MLAAVPLYMIKWIRSIRIPRWSAQAHVVYPLAFALRMICVAYGEWQDRKLEIQYTDVDYEVLSDAADLVLHGRSPYDRATFRYSPLLAYLLVPNLLIHKCWGKVIFSISDLVVGRLLQIILIRHQIGHEKALGYASLWLLNPLSINVSTRGSFDAVTSALVLWTVATLLEGYIVSSALAFGVVVHLRIYPIIYAPAFILHLARRSLETAHGSEDYASNVRVWLKLVSPRPLLFAAISAAAFFVCTLASIWAYREQFVHHSLLHHITRTDNRHNYSLYWYWIYLEYGASHRRLLGLTAFIPQVIMLIASASLLHQELVLCVVVQTAFFVFCNKVFTGQYMTWYLCLAPLLAPHLVIREKMVSLILVGWLIALSMWLYVAWNLEMKGENVFLPLWATSIVFFMANIVTLSACIRAFTRRGHTHVS